MATGKRRREDPRREATRTALIEAAESLFAESGVEGVSTRQIGAAIGSANTNVVSYHFGSKEALIHEVYRYRLPDIDRRRGELLAQADAAGQGHDMADLLRAFALPLFEQVDAQGQHSYARFLLGIERTGMMATRGDVSAEFPETDRLTDRIRACLPVTLRSLFHVRLRLLAGMVSTTLLLIDREAADNPDRSRTLFDNTISMASAALTAPAPQETTSGR